MINNKIKKIQELQKKVEEYRTRRRKDAELISDIMNSSLMQQKKINELNEENTKLKLMYANEIEKRLELLRKYSYKVDKL